jgi:hypothetical protein
MTSLRRHSKTQQPDIVPTIAGEIIEALLDHDVEGVLSLALSMIPWPLPKPGPSLVRASVVAALLLRKIGEAGWPAFWPAMQQDRVFAETVLARLVWNDHHTGTTVARLADEQLADLYIWLTLEFPPEGDPKVNGPVEFRAAVGMWRDATLTQLKLRGTEGACRAIGRIVAEFPERQWLKATLLDARTLMRQYTWTPPQPREIRALAESADRRWVQNADQLLDVVVESLRRLETKLQLGEPPAAIDLWDEIAKDSCRPKDEERLSDYLKRHLDADLRDRGIIFNREVTNRRGEETDIRVEALLRDPDGEVLDVLSVIIETKGNWNDQLNRAMETQLVRRYLAEAQTTHGLYVVGWYSSDRWDHDDWRYKSAPKHGKAQAQQRFDAQAAELSQAGKTVRAVVLDSSLHY